VYQAVTSAPPSRPVEIAGSHEALSAREVEVLSLLADGLTNPEIAARLYITPGTVKRHTINIYGNLGVNNRTQTVTRGRELGLLA